MNNYDDDLRYLRGCLEAAPLIPYLWDGEDRNIGAFRSKEDLVTWYSQPPGVENQPYRDRAFYTRELAHLSRTIQPRSVVEFGTCQGIGTCLLRWLNPQAKIVTVDVSLTTYLYGDNQRVPIGHLAKHQGIVCDYVRGNSWDYHSFNVDLCFIDADHSYEAVIRDSWRAWENKSTDHLWAIAWHDYNGRHPGVVRAVAEFCVENRIALQSRDDSDTVWVTGGP